MDLEGAELERLLKEHGELIVTMDSGEKVEIHKSDTHFFGSLFGFIDAEGSKHFYNAGKVESAEVHRSHRM